VYAAQGVLSVHTERGTSIVPANRVAWIPAEFTHYHRAHGQTDMRIEFLPASLARLVPGHPAVFLASDLAREALLTLTGPRNYDRDAGLHDRAARAAFVASSSTNSTKLTSSRCSCPNRTTIGCKPSPGCSTRLRPTTPRWPNSGRGSEPAPARSAACYATNSA